MIKNMAYLIIGFTSTFLALEVAWHLSACKVHDRSIQSRLFIQAKKILLIRSRSSLPIVQIKGKG
jgi:hypothetical protein